MKAMLLLALALALALALSACQSGPSDPSAHAAHQRGAGAGTGASAGSSSAGAATASSAGEKAGEGSWYGMCSLNQRIMGAGTAEERQFIIEQALPDMPQVERERQLQMMEQSCR
jgi:hypothetical protein